MRSRNAPGPSYNDYEAVVPSLGPPGPPSAIGGAVRVRLSQASPPSAAPSQPLSLRSGPHVGESGSVHFINLFQNCAVISGPAPFHRNFSMSLLVSTKKWQAF